MSADRHDIPPLPTPTPGQVPMSGHMGGLPVLQLKQKTCDTVRETEKVKIKRLLHSLIDRVDKL